MSQDRPKHRVYDANDDYDREDPLDVDEPRASERVRSKDEPPTSPPAEVVMAAEPKVAHSTQACVMLGPVKSGKTTLLTAIKRACDQPSDDGLNLEFIPGAETARKIKIAVNNIVERRQGHAATTDVGTFPFEVHVSARPRHFWSPPLEEDLYVVMSDGAGGFLLPSHEIPDGTSGFRSRLIETARTAKSLILCVDISNPASTTLEKELAISFAEMSTLTPTWSTVHWTAKLWAWLRRRPVPQPRKRMKSCLNVDRFLLLLTQVDKLCHQLPQGVDRTVRFAEMIDPVEQARELLGVPVLKTIQNSLKPGAQFAVGVISAMGFHPRTGDPFADVDGTPLNLDSESGEDILRRWTPFGIRDAIYFLATGKCRGRVKELHPVHLRVGPEPLEFSYNATSHKEA
jgi:hypothetical protein